MKLLVDTHALLWFLLKDGQLSDNASLLMTAPTNDVLVSPASYWEIAIKLSLRKYSLTEDFGEFMERQIAENEFAILPITPRHAAIVATLPFHHRDPFDRLLIAQAIGEQVPLISSDTGFDMYPVVRIW